jgi:hypothetical protein
MSTRVNTGIIRGISIYHNPGFSRIGRRPVWQDIQIHLEGKGMETLTIFFIFNATLLLLHEIESAYEKEWEIFKLPGGITAFLLLHIPILLFLFYGAVEIQSYSRIGMIIGILSGIGGLIPFAVHKIFVKRKDHFNLAISNIIIYTNILTGIMVVLLSARFFI